MGYGSDHVKDDAKRSRTMKLPCRTCRERCCNTKWDGRPWHPRRRATWHPRRRANHVGAAGGKPEGGMAAGEPAQVWP